MKEVLLVEAWLKRRKLAIAAYARRRGGWKVRLFRRLDGHTWDGYGESLNQALMRAASEYARGRVERVY